MATPIVRFIPHRILRMGHLKAIIYETPVDSIEDVVARLSIAAANVREMPGIIGTVCQPFLRRYQACINVVNRNFEHLL
ncbi:hypothetical protein AVEN_54364-1 [Araneus ventricosus]|uniref:Uncharacterized protein n=1 Tax=Araneus ventricosus TaxID=182803 RepID=A0A4Y2NJ37_ARAVE|nr:hypothetical protein AVEN_54364-1 [Araneus ventricosus]